MQAVTSKKKLNLKEEVKAEVWRRIRVCVYIFRYRIAENLDCEGKNG